MRELSLEDLDWATRRAAHAAGLSDLPDYGGPEALLGHVARWPARQLIVWILHRLDRAGIYRCSERDVARALGVSRNAVQKLKRAALGDLVQ